MSTFWRAMWAQIFDAAAALWAQNEALNAELAEARCAHIDAEEELKFAYGAYDAAEADLDDALEELGAALKELAYVRAENLTLTARVVELETGRTASRGWGEGDEGRKP